ncbi:MAG: hypothetical protein QNJ30_09280 [Kiloniellales bacterium]|nr:hypothetical protein [Kiloniellales bacterium]
MRTPVLIALFLGAITSPVLGQEPQAPRPGPHWTAADLRNLHGPYNAREMRILVLKSSDRSPAETSSIATLGPDYVSLATEAGQTIIDTKLKRLLQVDRKAGTFRNDSLFAPVTFIQSELRNRSVLRNAMQRSQFGTDSVPKPLQVFWTESELGAETNREAKLDLEQIDHKDGSVSVLHAGEIVAGWKPSRSELTLEQAAAFGLLLQYNLKLHPRIRRALMQSGKLPAFIRYKRAQGNAFFEEEYRFRILQQPAAAYPLDEKLRPFHLSEKKDPFYRDLLPVMIDAVFSRHVEGPKSLEDYVREARAAVRRDALFEAWLTLMEGTLHYLPRTAFCNDGDPGSASCLDAEVVQDMIGRDDRILVLRGALSREQRTRNPEATVETLVRLSRKGVTRGYLLDVFAGNALSEAPELEAKFGLDPARLIAEGIRRNPYVPNFYKELGDHYARRNDLIRAFACYDLGRSLPNRQANDTLEEISAMEAELERLFPDFF